jgi:hypothetical protein
LYDALEDRPPSRLRDRIILRRADFGINALPAGIAIDVYIFIAFEGTKK